MSNDCQETTEPTEIDEPIEPMESAEIDEPSEFSEFAEIPVPQAPVVPVYRPSFDLLGIANPNFPQLDMGRAQVYADANSLRSFTTLVASLEDKGDAGLRKGLGMWMLARHDEAVALLTPHADDDVAAFTLARALCSIKDWDRALAIYTKLTEKYPEERRPRCGMLEAQLEANLAKGDQEAAVAALLAGVEAAPASFREGPEHHYLAGRAFELQREWEEALDAFHAARELDGANRENLFRLAHLAERCGLDELALVTYEALAAMLPIDTTVLMNLGVLFEDLGRDQDAAACYETVTRHDPLDLRARRYLVDATAAIHMYYDEDQERKEDRLNQILRIPITDFELSVRARNCLNRMNINTIGDLVGRTEQELLSYKNFGETSLKEIKDILTSKSLRLGMSHEEAVASVEQNTLPALPAASPESDSVNNRPISDLNLSIRARRTVETLGCLTFGDVLKHSSDELLGMPNFGVTSLNELRSKLTELGLKLRGEN